MKTQINDDLKHKKAFTLVELIIVITILVILATIAFVSFQNYTKDSRDANRLTTINNISKGLDVFQIKTGFYPEPESKTSFSGAGDKKLHQGIISDNITNTINLSEIPLDPKEKTNYIYSTYGDGKYYQIASEAENITSFLYNTTYAENKSSIVKGNYKFDPSLPSLIVIPNSLTGSSIFDPKVCFVTNGGLNSITSISGSCLKKEEMSLNIIDKSLVGYWDMESLCNDVNCGNISNSGYIKNLATNDLNTLSGTVLKNHNNANYINKTFTGNSIMGKGSAYITDFDSALQTSDNIKNIEKNMTVSIMVKPNFTTNFDGNFGNTWNRNFFYDYYSDKIRFALLNEAIGVATYKNNNHYQLFAKGFNFEKDKTYILTTSQTITLSGESLNSQMNLYINGLKYKNYTSGNIKSGNSSYSLTGGVFHFGSSSNNPDACGTQASQFAQFNMVTQGCTFNGLIDEVKIYNRALSDEEISQQARIAGF